LFVILGTSLAAVIAIVVGCSLLFNKTTPQPRCPEDCQAPPIAPAGPATGTVQPGPPVPTAIPGASGGNGQGYAERAHTDIEPVALVPMSTPPVETFERFHSPDGQFSVAYPNGAHVYDDGASWTQKDGSVVQLFGLPAEHLSAREVAERFEQRDVPDATFGYEIPNARAGYESGYGEFDDYFPQSSSGRNSKWRYLVMVAVKNDVALVALATGPFYQDKDEPGHASGASMDVAGELGYFVNSFSWKGDPPR
jgi:hypothetical protein